MTPTRFALLCLLPIILTGCQSLNQNWTARLPWNKTDRLVESSYPEPIRMAAIWSPDLMTLPGNAPVRGFGGRFFFYDQRDQAIPVEGQLVVYAYDDSQTINGTESENQRRPDRKFVYTPDQFTRHFSESELGASYSVWLPWDPVGGVPKNISLLPVFTSANGKVVIGQPAPNLLPGKSRQPVEPARSTETPAAVQPVSHLSDVPEPLLVPAALQTTTIRVPPSLRQRMANSEQWASNPGHAPAAVEPAQALQTLQQLWQSPDSSSQQFPLVNSPQQAPAGPPDRFGPQRFPAPRVPIGQSTHAPTRSQRHPLTRPSGPPSASQLPAHSISPGAAATGW